MFIPILKLCFHPQIDAGRPVEEVFESVKALFTPKDEKVKGRRRALWGFFQNRLCFRRRALWGFFQNRLCFLRNKLTN